jgi:hypothetical protein
VSFTHLIVAPYLHGVSCKKTAFYQQLVDDIQRYNFRALPIERLALRYSHPLSSVLYLMYYRTKRFLKQVKRKLQKNPIPPISPTR